jgi:negative regulator of sigma E activity
MTFSEETVMAYADGELDAATCAAVEAAMATDPELARRIAQHRALRDTLRSAFDPVMDEPVPARLSAAAHGRPDEPRRVVPLRPRAVARWSWPHWSALAASLILGLMLGPWLMRPAERAPLVTSDGALLAQGSLARALSQQLASSQSAIEPVQIGVSFRSRSGAYCRTFAMRDKNVLAGLACHEQGNWHVEALAMSEPSSAGDGYRTAATALPPAIAGTLDALIAGEPLDARAEAAARASGWGQ